VPLQAKLHDLVTLALQIGVWKVDLGLAVRYADNWGELIGTTFSVSLKATWERIWIHGIYTRAISCNAVSGVAAITSIGGVQKGVEESSLVCFARRIGKVLDNRGVSNCLINDVPEYEDTEDILGEIYSQTGWNRTDFIPNNLRQPRIR